MHLTCKHAHAHLSKDTRYDIIILFIYYYFFHIIFVQIESVVRPKLTAMDHNVLATAFEWEHVSGIASAYECVCVFA